MRLKMAATHVPFHPVRWALCAFAAIPIALAAAVVFAGLKQNREAVQSIRAVLRCTLIAECAIVLSLGIWGAIYERRSQARDRRMYPPPGQLVDIGGESLHIYCTGQGSPTVVLEHGLDGSYLDWRQVQPDIAQFTRVCSYDRAGYGYSDRSGKARVPSMMVEELHALLTNAGEKPPFIIVGHSMGAFDALMYAHRYPDSIAALVLVDGSHPDERLPFPWQEKIELRFLQFSSYFGLPRWRKWCAGGDENLRAQRAAVYCKPRVFSTHYQQWSAFPEAAAEIRNLPKSLTLPIVVISRDPKLARDAAQEQHWTESQRKLLELSPHSVQTIALDSGHDVPGKRPDIIVDAVRRLLEQLAQSGAAKISHSD
jgi:pimeloyl-ACP methyl ester carboxylesterase